MPMVVSASANVRSNVLMRSRCALRIEGAVSSNGVPCKTSMAMVEPSVVMTTFEAMCPA